MISNCMCESRICSFQDKFVKFNFIKQIIWERADLVYPLAVGTHIFSPDARLSVHYLSVNLSQLIISNAIKEDAKLYRCRSARQKSPVCANDTCIEQNEAFELTFRAIFGKFYLMLFFHNLVNLVNTNESFEN